MQNLVIYNIATINVKTQGQNFRKNKLFQGEKNVKILADFIREEGLDSIGTQELTYRHQKALIEELGSKYQILGEYRYGNGLREKIPFNESNAIITQVQQEQKLKNKTFHLPSFPTKNDFKNQIQTIGFETFAKMIQQRICTVTVDEIRKLIHINTHLHDAFPEKRKQQELYVVGCASAFQSEYPEYEIVVTGDFNDHIDNPSFYWNCIHEMKNIGFEWIPIKQRTYSKQSENVAIDHIFISNGLSLEDFKVCDVGDITTTTDHYPVIAKVKRK